MKDENTSPSEAAQATSEEDANTETAMITKHFFGKMKQFRNFSRQGEDVRIIITSTSNSTSKR